MAEQEKKVKLGKENKVENISKFSVHLASGIIDPGKTGKATAAECSSLYKLLKVV